MAHMTFPISCGKVIRGWDQGVITMSLGEKAKFFYKHRGGANRADSLEASPPGTSSSPFQFCIPPLTTTDEISSRRPPSIH